MFFIGQSIEQLISNAEGDISTLLDKELFIKSIKDGDPDGIEELNKHVKDMLDILFLDLDDYDEMLLEHLSYQWDTIIDLFELKIESIQNQLQLHWEIIFTLRLRHLVPDVQWAYAHKIFEFVYSSNPTLPQKFINTDGFLVSFFPHLNVTSVVSILIHFFEMKFHQQQIHFLELGIQQFLQLDKCAVINFTYIIHEIMTRILNKDLISFILRAQVLKQMFLIIRQDINPITLKNAAHIISLVSNYYSMKLQNIDLEDSDIEETIQDFEQSEFFQTILGELHAISEILDRPSANIGLLKIKLVEIVDNLIRITNLKLWNQIQEDHIIQSITQLVQRFPKSDILISYVDKLVSFILDRALSDFHPYWAQQLILVNKIHLQKLPVIQKQFHWFAKELNEKLMQEGDFNQNFKILTQLQNEFDTSDLWKLLCANNQFQEKTTQIVLGEYLEGPLESPVVVSALKILDEDLKDKNEEAPLNIFIKCHQEEETNPWEEIKVKRQDSDDDQVVAISNEYALDQLKCIFNKFDEQPKTRKRHSATLEVQVLHGAKNLSNSCGDNGHNKKQALTSSCKLKQLNHNFDEFQIDFENNRKILRKNDKSVLKVDEIDDLTEKNERIQLLKVEVTKQENQELKIATELIEKQFSSNKVINVDKGKQVEVLECMSADSLRFRKIKEEDKAFLDYIKKIE